MPFTPVAPGVLQRKCACGTHSMAGGKCESCRKKNLSLQRKFQDSGLRAQHSDAVPPIVHEVLRSPGQPLDLATRDFFEPRFGHDLSQVCVHTDAKAAKSAWAVNALAYTAGNNIVFGARQFAPRTPEGRTLFAHELTHVVQQRHVTSQSRLPAQINQSSDSAEVEASKVASEITGDSRPSSFLRVAGHRNSPFDRRSFVRVKVAATPSIIHRSGMPWPLNGYVINDSADPVTVWSDDGGFSTIAAGDTSGRFTEDIDHIRDRRGQWYKIGANTVTVDATGEISGYKCEVWDYGQDCPIPTGDFPMPTGPTRYA